VRGMNSEHSIGGTEFVPWLKYGVLIVPVLLHGT
jgi:hypothetical protein